MEFLQELEVIMVSILKIRGVNRETMKTGGSVHPGRGGTPLFGLCGDVPLDRVWFLASLS